MGLQCYLKGTHAGAQLMLCIFVSDAVTSVTRCALPRAGCRLRTGKT